MHRLYWGITIPLGGADVCNFFLFLAFFFYWDSVHLKLNSNYKARSDKKKMKKITKTWIRF